MKNLGETQLYDLKFYQVIIFGQFFRRLKLKKLNILLQFNNFSYNFLFTEFVKQILCSFQILQYLIILFY
ncbi:unnamed protein product (macronuclear) [Paramecium tetraurelia]|uniref:Transmembrane protein n=1 Tax=Paramecium tetraurelia TaxID=5888 RepID=A0EGU5_PARTE|nr:uncharacterized protein GSPATT00026860001 [Paramecium tetraurelia]CAK94536.1 unnamed protein product [Paramecium tetraurelia]|eukprot:XP_001461909.1 hypothetical protein (macronuclear) [Paramecium tetraurelia strain d4-2]